MNSNLRSPNLRGFRKGLLLFAMVFFVALVPSLIGSPVKGVTGESGRGDLLFATTAPPRVNAASAAPMQMGGSFEIKPSVIAGGGGTSTNGNTRLDGTVGQGVLGTSSGGNFTLNGGFWQSAQQPQFAATISGTITNCANTVTPPGVNNVAVAIVGPSMIFAPTTNASGFYTQAVAEAGLFTITPSKTALAPGAPGINVGDVIRAQQIFLTSLTPTACQQKAADINEDTLVNVQDVNGIRRFFLTFATGIFNAGQWRFIPTSATPNVTGNTTQNFQTVALGDVTGDVAAGPVQQAAQGSQSSAPMTIAAPAVEASVSLPVASVGTNVVGTFSLPIPVTDTTGKNYIGFQADFTFNQTIVNITAATATGLTASNWSVSGNLLPDTTPPIRTFRFIGNVNDGDTPLTGAGALINLTVTRVSNSPGANTALTWGTGPLAFKFLERVMFTLVDAVQVNGSINIGNPPTAARLSSFKAIAYDDGVHLNWQTGFEAENLGFNIYREVAGDRTLVNPDIIAGSALTTGIATRLQAGQSYGWWDSTDGNQRNAQYWIEEIDLNGLRTMHGPFGVRRVGGKPPRESQAELLSQIGRGAPTVHQLPMSYQPGGSNAVHAEVSTMATAPKLSALPALKLTIREEGWYRVTQQDLTAAGFDAGRNPRNLQLYLNGVEQPIRVVGEQDGRVDAIEFFGTGQDKATTDARVYWLVSGDAVGSRIGVVKGEGKSGGARSFPFTVERRDRTVYFSSLRNGDAENFFGQVVTSKPVDQVISLRHLDSTSSDQAELEVAMQGVTDQAAGHSVRVLLNGLQVGKLVFSGQSHKAQKFTVSRELLKEGDNVVTLAAEVAAGDVSLVDYIRVTYPHSYTADQDSLRMIVASGSQTIEGFSDGSVRVFDITDPSAPVELAGSVVYQGGSYVVSVEMAGQGTRTLLALTDNRIKAPASITLNESSNWRNKKNRADLLIITRSEFFPALEPLKALRESQGLRVRMVDIADIYDEFSDGERNPQAVRDFLLTATTTWKRKPAFVLFAGHASLDPRNHLGFGDSDIVPTKLIDTGLMETASDDWFVDFNDDGVPELAVGRLPFRTQSEAVTMVSKILSYERSSPANEALLVADANDGFDFETASGQVRDMLPTSLKVNRIDRGRVDAAAAKAALIDAINRGQKIVNYMGHGSVSQWKGDLLTNDDARRLTNADHLPLFVMMTCLNGYFQDAVLDSLAESLLKAERGGAVAVWASSGMTDPSEQTSINQQLYMSLFGAGLVKDQALTLGQAIMRAKAATGDADVRRTWVLLGDPSMRIK